MLQMHCCNSQNRIVRGSNAPNDTIANIRHNPSRLLPTRIVLTLRKHPRNKRPILTTSIIKTKIPQQKHVLTLTLLGLRRIHDPKAIIIDANHLKTRG